MLKGAIGEIERHNVLQNESKETGNNPNVEPKKTKAKIHIHLSKSVEIGGAERSRSRSKSTEKRPGSLRK